MEKMTKEKSATLIVFHELDQRLFRLNQRRLAAQEQIDKIRASVEQGRAAYRMALAKTEMDQAQSPSRAELQRAEAALMEAEDLHSGLEQAIKDLTPEWELARIAMLREEIVGFNAQRAKLEERVREVGEERERLFKELARLSIEMQALDAECRPRTEEIEQSLAKRYREGR